MCFVHHSKTKINVNIQYVDDCISSISMLSLLSEFLLFLLILSPYYAINMVLEDKPEAKRSQKECTVQQLLQVKE